MAERERFRTDLRSVRIGLVRGVIGAVFTFAFFFGLIFMWTPVAKDLGGRLWSPSPFHAWVPAALVGGALGWSGMRSARRIVAAVDDGGTGTFAGSSALYVARANRLARADQRVTEPIAVRRWSHDLLVGGDLHEDSGGVTE